jgi:phytoene dehydrogenase-like protein
MASVSASDGLPHQPLCASDGLPHQPLCALDGLPHQVRDWEKPITAEDNCVFICVASALDPNAAPEGHHVHASPPARNQLCDDLFEAECETDCET